jgi:hypothetical protein
MEQRSQDGVSGNALFELNGPFDVITDNDEGLYIADAWNHRIVYWSNSSSTGRIIAGNGT